MVALGGAGGPVLPLAQWEDPGKPRLVVTVRPAWQETGTAGGFRV